MTIAHKSNFSCTARCAPKTDVNSMDIYGCLVASSTEEWGTITSIGICLSICRIHFTINGTDKVKCGISSMEFAYHNSTTVVREHLNRRHPQTEYAPSTWRFVQICHRKTNRGNYTLLKHLISLLCTVCV